MRSTRVRYPFVSRDCTRLTRLSVECQVAMGHPLRLAKCAVLRKVRTRL